MDKEALLKKYEEAIKLAKLLRQSEVYFPKNRPQHQIYRHQLDIALELIDQNATTK